MKKGIVIKSTGSFYTVRISEDEELACSIRGRLRTKGIRSTNPVAVGDWVDVEEDKDGCVITHIHERKNYLIRKSTNLSKESHIIASNIDQAVIIITISHPETSAVFIDRFLATCEAYTIRAILIFNKIDIYNEQEQAELEELIGLYEHIGYDCYAVSAKENTNIGEVKDIFQDKTTVLSGISGVGKSSLVNRIEPGLNLKTGTISTTHNTGKHTTTFAEMFPLSGGGFIIDTPGIRSFGMIDMKKEEISHYFPEIFKYSKDCRFHNCTHLHEPGCAVIEAIQEGHIHEKRYFSYISMMEEDGEKYR
ncbi:ribosome small subunit-dependent GTPase A [Porphyromonadaceae bacterium OttesenSCG-928-L07]|nr:ribosome small subunit-dependent GTPase A [Porphyromonadaceae bacterium OttesenSCG-928-L07]MDL2252119.1 ribosome small subunit-dependent GTPase A [Odoribacter sp. OttesenSCG-928-J03]MDL2330743.1 ribosome small subunit-dependent GTPase A [Odoribacter sp. OttesenSCG-928-A06]